MKLLYTCAVDLRNFDAQRTHIVEMMRILHESGHDVQLILPQFGDHPVKLPFPNHPIPVRLGNSRLKFVEYEIRLLRVLWQICRRRRPDVLYTRKGFLTLCPNWVGKLLGIRSVVEVNGIVADEVGEAFGLPPLLRRFFAIMERMCCRGADHLVAVTPGLKDLLEERYRVSAENITVVPNGVNTRMFVPGQRVGKSDKTLGFVGNLVRWAGVEVLIKALPAISESHPEVRCLIVGDGLERENLTRLAADLGVADRVIFTGKVPPPEVPALIATCDICYVPAIPGRNSRIGGSSLKLYEYMACGIATVVSDIPGLNIVGSEGVGRVVPAGDAAALAAASLDLLACRENLREMGARARRLAERQFSWHRATREVLAVCGGFQTIEADLLT
ncbi:MAG: glycosyltransferase family 4 protein [Calditrichaeota bacterium]|nr:glycosyltransferase family 4 protein [Calditrichota bacterium]